MPKSSSAEPQQTLTPRQSIGWGVFWLIFSITAFQGMIGSIKTLSPELSPYEVGFWRNALAIPMILPFVLYFCGPRIWQVQSPKALGSRACAEFGLSAFNFLAVTLLPLAQTTALILTAPIWTILGAALFLRERVSKTRLISVLLGFTGMLVIVGPVFDETSLLIFLPIIAAMFWASSNIILRRVSLRDRIGHIMLWMALLQTPMFLVIAGPGWTWPSAEHWPLLIFCAACGTLGQYGLTMAHRCSEASQLAPFGYAELIIAATVGAVIFSESPPISTFIGGAIIAAAGIYMARQEHKELKRRKLETDA
ncbi:MAG: DMT family transporter [Alphaproteobacteria bacterium]|nr:DMT family transporter [Alphaproteobacteria bacterium SS10]